jgi:hypothetical protein
MASRAAACDLGSPDQGQLSYRIFTVLVRLWNGGCPYDRPCLCPPPRIQHYEEGATEETCKVNLDSIKEHCVVARMRHTFHEQQICRYHDHNMRERSFNVDDLVLRCVQDTKGMHKISAPSEGPFIVHEVIGPATYHLRWADGQGIPNIKHLRRFYH